MLKIWWRYIPVKYHHHRQGVETILIKALCYLWLDNPIQVTIVANMQHLLNPLKFYESPNVHQSWLDHTWVFRDWTSTYRDQKSTIKRCKWKVTGENLKSSCKWKLFLKCWLRILSQFLDRKFAEKIYVFHLICWCRVLSIA